MGEALLDTFIERWCGPLLFATGIFALGYAAYGILTTPPLTLPAEGPITIIYGQRDPRERFLIWVAGGVALVGIGARLIRHFRRERRSLERSA